MLPLFRPHFRASSSSKSCDHNPGNVDDDDYTWYYDSGHLLLGMNVCQHSSHRLFLGLKKAEFTTIQAVFNREHLVPEIACGTG